MLLGATRLGVLCGGGHRTLMQRVCSPHSQGAEEPGGVQTQSCQALSSAGGLWGNPLLLARAGQPRRAGAARSGGPWRGRGRRRLAATSGHPSGFPFGIDGPVPAWRVVYKQREHFCVAPSRLLNCGQHTMCIRLAGSPGPGSQRKCPLCWVLSAMLPATSSSSASTHGRHISY